MSLKQIVEGTETRAGRLFDSVITGFIFLAVVSFSFETLPNLRPEAQALLRWVEIVCVFLFTVEYFLRVVVADRKVAFILSMHGLIDLAAILPFYIALGVDLRSIRAVRLLRFLRILKLARYTRAIDRFRRAGAIAREELLVFLGGAGVLIYLSAVGIYYFENEAQPEIFVSVFHSLWWSVVTLTTVGYGDVYPISTKSKLIVIAQIMCIFGILCIH